MLQTAPVSEHPTTPAPDAKPATYILRGIDPAIWRQVKAKAALSGLTLRAVLMRAVERYITE